MSTREKLSRVLAQGILPALAVVAIGLLLREPREKPSPFDHVVLVTIDTLRADHLGLYGYPRPTSPFLDTLARSSIVFRHALASGSTTAPTHASILTSLFAPQHGVFTNGLTLDPSIPTMADSFFRNGFRTAAFVSVRFLTGLDSGFETFDAKIAERMTFRPASATVDAALAWLRTRKPQERLFLWVHLFDVHQSDPAHEALIPPAHLDRIRADSRARREALLSFLSREHGIPRAQLLNRRESLRRTTLLQLYDRYDAQISYVDSEIARLFAAWKRIESGSNTLWILTADHGEGLGSHGLLSHGRHLYNEQLRVPLILHAEDRRWSPRWIESLVRHVDLWPTTAELAGVSLDRESRIEGKSLLPVLEGRDESLAIEYSFSQRRTVDPKRISTGWLKERVIAAQNLEYKYIMHESGGDELFHLATDRLESKNLVDGGLPSAEIMARWLRAEYRRLSADRRYERIQTIDQQTLEDLKALGYVGN